ncbi:MAG: hypothetical protein MAG453_01769 [Calditrichaeota bacterium]|nr:hypothetical protein [Calditrichota bacterium]
MSPSRRRNGREQRKPMVGGQAVLEGVMMRSPWRVAVAVRSPDGAVITRGRPFVSLTKRRKLFGLPVVRGAIGLFEALRIGMDALSWSARIADPESEEKRRGKPVPWDTVLSITFALVLAVGLFMLVPYLAASATPAEQNPFLFHLIAGGLRVTLLILYMVAISLLPDITRVFQYHGAEHKSIFAWERDLELVNGNACAMSRFHPRCGTSFLLLAAVLTMIGFAFFDAAWAVWIGDYANVFQRLLVHLPAIPLIAGLAYEVLRIVERHADEPLWQPLVKPGFSLQRITTREPDAAQVDVALHSLREALVKDEGAHEGPARCELGAEDRPGELRQPAHA